MNLRYVSTVYEGRLRHTSEEVVPFVDDGGKEEHLINLYPQIKYQKIEGFGGAITDSAAYVYSLMEREQKQQLLTEYFGTGNMKYRFVRIPIDSCDFSLEHYEADGDEEDALFTKFSFARIFQFWELSIKTVSKWRFPVHLLLWKYGTHSTNAVSTRNEHLLRCW